MTDVSITGPRSSNERIKKDRLFVPLSAEPFDWFLSGKKKWELRKFGRQYTPEHVRTGRQVELRRGYSSDAVLWGTIVQVVEARGIYEIYNIVPFAEIIPTATSLSDAVETTKNILKIDNDTKLIAFSVGGLG